jgi:hypothetical protein
MDDKINIRRGRFWMISLTLSLLAGLSCGSEGVPTSPMIVVPAGQLKVDTAALDFGYTGSEFSLEILNDGQGSLSWTVGATPQWASLDIAAGVLSPGSGTTVRVIVSRAGLSSGDHSGLIQLNSNGGSHTLQLRIGVLEPRGQGDTEVNVRDHGAVGDGLHDDTPAFNAALTALGSVGGTLYVPHGTYILTPESGTPDRALDLSNFHDIVVTGDGAEKSVIKMAPGQYQGDTHLVFLRRSRYIVIEDLTLDGNKQSAKFSDEQNHCVEVWSSVDIKFQRVRFQNCRGDGIRFMGAPAAGEPWAEALVVQDSEFADNGRSGIAVQRAVRNLTIARNLFEHISDQSIDIEPTGGAAPTDIVIEENIIRHSTTAWAVGIGGVGGGEVARRLTFANNQVLQGAVLVYKVDQLKLEDNVIIGDPMHVPLRITHSVTNSLIFGNELRSITGGEEGALQVVALSGSYPATLLLRQNIIRVPQNSSGIFIRDALGGIELRENQILGSGGTSGIHITNNIQFRTPRSGFVIADNEIKNFANGVQFSTRGDAFAAVSIVRNAIGGDAGIISQIIGIVFDRTGPYENFATIEANNFGTGVSQPILVR